jgi:glycosyltransferase involved in cell wall biosynthesis
MRIAHVVPYISVDGAFGGPIAVADAQTRELALRGHEVQLIAGWDGKARIEIPGVDVRLFRTTPLGPLGFSGLLAPSLLKYLRSDALQLDVVHIHAGRHAISVQAALSAKRRGLPYVLQTHGMVMPDSRAKSRIADALGMKTALRGAATVLALTEREVSGLLQVASGLANIRQVRNGIALSRDSRKDRAIDAVPEVLFLARLHPRKRVMAFAKMAELLETRGLATKFAVIGPDEGDLAELQAFITSSGLRSLNYEGSIAPGVAHERLAKADVFVLPSVGEVFPMTVLEAMSVGTPVVLARDCGISEELQKQDAAVVTDGSPEELADAVSSLLLDKSRRASVQTGMKLALENTFGIAAVVNDLEFEYESAVGG